MIPIARTISLAVALPLASFIYSQPAIQWQRCLGGGENDEAVAIQPTTDAGYIVAGFTLSTDGDVIGQHGGGNNDAWVVKLDSIGSIVWQRCLGGTGSDNAYDICQTVDGGFVMAGNAGIGNGDVVGIHTGGHDAWIVKLDSGGVIQWQNCLGGSSGDDAFSIEQTLDGGFVVGGNTDSDNGDVSGQHGSDDAWVVKLDDMGEIQWQKCLGGALGDYAFSLKSTVDGGYVMVGITESNNGDVSGNHGGRDVWAVKMDASGALEWQRCLGGSNDDEAHSVMQTLDGGFVIAGFTQSIDGDVVGSNGLDAWVIKLDSTGVLDWQRCLGGSQGDRAYSIEQTEDGGFILAGSAGSSNGDVSGSHGGTDAWLVKLDASGGLVWQKCLGGSDTDRAFALRTTGDNGLVVAGETYSDDGDVSGYHEGTFYRSDAWVVKLGPVEVGITEQPTRFFSVAPNPTRGVIRLEFYGGFNPLQAAVLDPAGRSVSQFHANGLTAFALDLSNLKSGPYMVQILFADGSVATQRIIRE